MNWPQIIVLALGAAIYPAVLAGVILILTRPKPLPLLLGFLIGGLAVSLAAGFAVVAGLESSGVVKHNQSTRPVLDIVLGTAAVVIALGVRSGRITGSSFQRERSAKPKKPSLASRALARGPVWVLIGVLAGVLLNAPGMWYLNALANVAHANPSFAAELLALVVFNLLMFATVAVAVVAYAVNPQGASANVNNMSNWGQEHARSIGIVVAIVVGVYLIVKGIVNLP